MMEALTSQLPDISPLLVFQWYEPVLYAVESQIPNESKEKPGHFVGIAENCGHTMTFKVLTDDTQQVISISMVWSALAPADHNLHAEAMLNDSLPVKSLKSPSPTDPDSVPLDEPNIVVDMIVSPDGEMDNNLTTPYVQDNGWGGE
jgi:hypothetical protein